MLQAEPSSVDCHVHLLQSIRRAVLLVPVVAGVSAPRLCCACRATPYVEVFRVRKRPASAGTRAAFRVRLRTLHRIAGRARKIQTRWIRTSRNRIGAGHPRKPAARGTMPLPEIRQKQQNSQPLHCGFPSRVSTQRIRGHAHAIEKCCVWLPTAAQRRRARAHPALCEAAQTASRACA